MTDDPRSGRPWWEFDPDETPVPLDPDASWEVGDDAELIVASQRVAIERQDTEPNLATLIAKARTASVEGADRPEIRRPRKRSAVLALAVGCIAMFIHGYSYGSAARSRAESERSTRVNPVTSDRNQPDWLGEQSTKA